MFYPGGGGGVILKTFFDAKKVTSKPLLNLYIDLK